MEIQNMASVKSQFKNQSVQKNAGSTQKKKSAGSDAVGGFQMLFGSMQTQAGLRTNSSRMNAQKTLQKSGTISSTKSSVYGNRGNVSTKNSAEYNRTRNTGTASRSTDSTRNNSWRELRETERGSGKFNSTGAAEAKDAAGIQNRNSIAENAKALTEAAGVDSAGSSAENNRNLAAGSRAKTEESQSGMEKPLTGAEVNGAGTSADMIHGTAGTAENPGGQAVTGNPANLQMDGVTDASADFQKNGMADISADLQTNGAAGTSAELPMDGTADASAGLPNGQAVSNGGRSGSQTEGMTSTADVLKEAALAGQNITKAILSGEANGMVEANSRTSAMAELSEEMADVSKAVTAGTSESTEGIAGDTTENGGKIPSEIDSDFSISSELTAGSSNKEVATESLDGQSRNPSAKLRQEESQNKNKISDTASETGASASASDKAVVDGNKLEGVQVPEKSGTQSESRKKASDKPSEERSSVAENLGQRAETSGDGLHFRMEDAVRPAGNEIINNKTPVDESIGKVFHPVTLQTSEKKLPEDISSYLAANLKDKSGSVEITLRPENLGNLTIRVSRDGEHTRFLILAESPATMHILREHAGEMGQLIKHATGEETLISVPEREAQDDRSMDMDTEGRSQNRREQNENKKRQEKQSGQDRFLNMMRLGIAE